jgi:hypothetical protein
MPWLLPLERVEEKYLGQITLQKNGAIRSNVMIYFVKVSEEDFSKEDKENL